MRVSGIENRWLDSLSMGQMYDTCKCEQMGEKCTFKYS